MVKRSIPSVFKYISILIAFAAIPAAAQTIDSIIIKGPSYLDESTFSDVTGVTQGSKYFSGMAESAEDSIGNYLAAMGYYNAATDIEKDFSADSANLNLIVSVRENEPVYVGEVYIRYDGNSSHSEKTRYLKSLKGEIFSDENIQTTAADVLTEFENNGYPFAAVTLESAVFMFDSVDTETEALLTFVVTPGIRVTIDKIVINGNDKTEPYVIKRAAGIEKGDLYNQSEIDAVPQRLNKLRYFKPVKSPAFYVTPDSLNVLEITVSEKQTNTFDGVIGYIPPDGNLDGYVAGVLNLSFRNLFGTGRAAAFKWNRIDRYSQELQLRYREPWLFGLPVNAGGEFYQKKQDTSYVTRSITAEAEYMTGEDLSFIFSISSESVIPSETDSAVFTVFNSSLVTTGLGLRYDTRTDPFAPVAGILFSNFYSYSSKEINGPERFITSDIKRSAGLQKIYFDLSYFVTVYADMVAAPSVHGRELIADFQENSDMFKIGGTSTLRGYREEQFICSRAFWTNIEYRYLLSERTFAFAFFDAGYYLVKEQRELNRPEFSDYVYGYGFGLNVETGLGMISVSFALAEGDSFGEGKIHFGLINEF